MKNLKNIFKLFNPNENKNFYLILLFIFFGMFLEALGIGVIFPALNLILDPNFIETLKSPSKNQLEWLKKSMEHPPKRLLNHLIENTRETIQLRTFERKKMPVMQKPRCFSCRNPIAVNMKESVHFSQITCTCFPKTFHNNCADEFVMKTPICTCCGKNIKLTRQFSSIQSTLERN